MVTYYHKEWGAQRPISGVLFDLDGLVLDTERLYTRFWREAAAFHGYAMSLEQALGMRSLERSEAIRQIQGYFGEQADYAAIRQTRIEMMEAYMAAHAPEPKPGIWELLDALQARGIPSAITSAAPLERIEAYLRPLGLFHRFQKVCSARQVARGKPWPDIYLFGAAQLEADPRFCLALEDSPTGILSAFRAGCLGVMIPDQDDPSETVRDQLYAKAESLADVIALL